MRSERNKSETASLFLELLAQQEIPNYWMFEGRHREQSAATSADPVDDDVLEVRVARASPFQTGAEHGVEVAARVVEGFEIENGNEYEHEPSAVTPSKANQTGQFFTGHDERCANETVENRSEFWIFLAQSL